MSNQYNDSLLEERLEKQKRERMNRNKNARKGSSRKKKKTRLMIRRIFFGMMAALSLTAGSFVAVVQYDVTSAFSAIHHDTKTDMSSAVDETDLLSEDDIVNILLVGSDKRSTWKQTGRSDSVMIATIDNKHKQLKLTSLMRDMYVDIPGYKKNRFNAAYSYGGVALLYQTIAENFGIKLDGYVLVDFQAFTDMIDNIGGVKIKLTEAEHHYLTTAYHRGSVLKVKAGMNNLNGEQALAYTRIRQDVNGDFGRTRRQRKVISAIFKEAKTKSFSELYDLAKLILPNLSTDLKDGEIISYMKTVLFMGTTEINQIRIPASNTYENQTIRGMKVLVPDINQNIEVLKEFIFEKSEGIKSHV